MSTLSLNLQNCYGITNLSYDFDFNNKDAKNRPIQKAYAIYAPNGLMKTSFAKTFSDLAADRQPKEERFNRTASASVLWDDDAIQPDQIYVLGAEVDLSTRTEAVTSLLVNQTQKAEYDKLVKELNALQSKLETELQKASGIKKADVETTLCKDMATGQDFIAAVQAALKIELNNDYAAFKYQDIFEPEALAILQSDDFIEQAEEFTSRYLALFEHAGSIYKKGEFNPSQAAIALTALDKQGYFKPGHLVHLAGEAEPLDYQQLKEKLDEVNQTINNDARLQAIQKKLAKNVKTQAITSFIENQPSSTVELLLENTLPSKQQIFKQQLWAYYLQKSKHAQALLGDYTSNKSQLAEIEQQAAEESPQWLAAIELFNQRFVDMPFKLAVSNQTEATLGVAAAQLVCRFEEEDTNEQSAYKDYSSTDIKSANLSQGEKRAFYLLNFIFEVENRKRSGKPTLFVIDDPADSFDYKNKHAILHYLKDLADIDYFYQIVLTHNFDFYRSLANSFVNRTRSLMANHTNTGIELTEAKAVNNVFVQAWKSKAHTCDTILCATIPFTRNIIEYTKGDKEPNYLVLTSLLHWKEDTEQITVDGYWAIYTAVFGSAKTISNGSKTVIALIFEQADAVANNTEQPGMDLEQKLLLSMAIRLKAEKYMTNTLKAHYANPYYWSAATSNQFGKLLTEFKEQLPSSEAVSILEQVSITVSSNIHLNSFMYEPILDLTKDHLVQLYQGIKNL
mgnify:CR=1 FL=1